jgi:hypothetical protein
MNIRRTSTSAASVAAAAGAAAYAAAAHAAVMVTDSVTLCYSPARHLSMLSWLCALWPAVKVPLGQRVHGRLPRMSLYELRGHTTQRVPFTCGCCPTPHVMFTAEQSAKHVTDDATAVSSCVSCR